MVLKIGEVLLGLWAAVAFLMLCVTTIAWKMHINDLGIFPPRRRWWQADSTASHRHLPWAQAHRYRNWCRRKGVDEGIWVPLLGFVHLNVVASMAVNVLCQWFIFPRS